MTRRTIQALTAAVVMAAAPLTVRGGQVEKSTAECQSGSCCSETSSICVINGVSRWHYYFCGGSGSGTGSGPDYKDIPW